jgi:hypothetical protein
VDELCEEFLDHYRQQTPVTRDRVVLWEATDLLTYVLHAWSKARVDRVQPRLLLLNDYLSSVRFSAPSSTYADMGV